MKRAVPLLVGLCVLATGAVAEAKTYRWVNDQGVVVYSDQPPQVRIGDKEHDALIAEALETSATQKSLESIRAGIGRQLYARERQSRTEATAGVRRILADAFRPDVLYCEVRAPFRWNFHAELMDVVWETPRSPLFRKIAAMELAATESGA